MNESPPEKYLNDTEKIGNDNMAKRKKKVKVNENIVYGLIGIGIIMVVFAVSISEFIVTTLKVDFSKILGIKIVFGIPTTTMVVLIIGTILLVLGVYLYTKR